jgi:hypothetical protein
MSDYQNEAETRALQGSETARQQNYEKMVGWGADSLVKVRVRGEAQTSVGGYVTHLMSISGRTPRQMEDVLGLRKNQLAAGADVYRLRQLPEKDGFEPRGYSTLVDGLRLKDGLKEDSAGFRPGHGAWQVTLTKAIEVTRLASLGYDDRFEPGPHPKYR